jgi:NAD(P)-dependent dehydrogenase (short-subunit alcohol dehydrogenase family)
VSAIGTDDPLFGVAGKVVVITGALGQIGTAFTTEFLSRGARVVAMARDVSAARAEAALGAYSASPNLLLVPVDITKSTSIEQALDTVQESFGTPDVLINNAGLDTQPSAPPEVSGPFEDFPEEVFREVLDVNLVGTFLMTKAVGRRMRQAERPGSIINIGSIYGMVSPQQPIYAYKAERGDAPFIKPVAYSVAKAGLYNFTRYCATYWARNGIRVNTLTPSGVGRDSQDAQFKANYTARMPMGRMATATDFNGAAVFLASDASSYMTGANLVVDGGWTAW